MAGEAASSSWQGQVIGSSRAHPYERSGLWIPRPVHSRETVIDFPPVALPPSRPMAAPDSFVARLEKVETQLDAVAKWSHESDSAWRGWAVEYQSQIQDMRTDVAQMAERMEDRDERDTIRFSSIRDRIVAAIRYEGINFMGKKLATHLLEFRGCTRWTMLSNLAIWMQMDEERLLNKLLSTSWGHESDLVRYRVVAVFLHEAPSVIIVGATDADLDMEHHTHILGYYKQDEDTNSIHIGINAVDMLRAYEQANDGWHQKLARENDSWNPAPQGHIVIRNQSELCSPPGYGKERRDKFNDVDIEEKFFTDMDDGQDSESVCSNYEATFGHICV